MFRSLIRLIFYVAALNSLFALALPNALAQTAPTLTVDAAGNPHPINPDIYGIASYSLDAGFAKEIQVPNVRWGGDATTRYNWEVDSSNAGFDWYFMGGNGQATPVPSASADLMVNTYKTASNAHALAHHSHHSVREQNSGVELQFSRVRIWRAAINQSLRSPKWRQLRQ